MELVLKEGSNSEWIAWGHIKAKGIKRFIDVARVKKDGYFYKQDMAILGEKISSLYCILVDDFEGRDIFQEEWSLLKDNLHTINAQQFTALINIMIDPYTDFTVKNVPDST